MYDHAAERSLLLAIMLSESVLYSVAIDDEGVRPHHFHDGANRVIYTAVMELFVRGEPVDVLTVTEILRRNDDLDLAGGWRYVHSLTDAVPDVADIHRYARTVRQIAETRER